MNSFDDNRPENEQDKDMMPAYTNDYDAMSDHEKAEYTNENPEMNETESIKEAQREDETMKVEEEVATEEAGNEALANEKPSATQTAKQEPKLASQTKKTKRKGNWGQTILSGIIGAVLMFGLVTYTPILEGQTTEDPASEDSFSLNEPDDAETEVTKTTAEVQDGSLADMVEEASKAIVGIVNYKKGQNPFAQYNEDVYEGGSGSGVIVKEEGEYAYVVTNNHVIEAAEKIEVSLANGETVDADLIGADALSDLAVLRISNDHVEKTLDFGDSSTLRAGEQVVAIGNPIGIEFSRTVTQGIISAVDRTIKTQTSAGNWDLHVIQTDAAINPGNSGGPLVNMGGEVIGINSLKIASGNVEGMGFAIPSNDVVPLIEEMVQKGSVSRPYIGISMVDLEQIPRSYLGDIPDSLESGVAVTDVDEQSPAGRGGIEAGDIIVGMDGEEIETIDDLRSILYKDLQVGDEVTFDVYRGKDEVQIDVKLTSDNME